MSISGYRARSGTTEQSNAWLGERFEAEPEAEGITW
jgi:hypothetical protein